MDNAQTLLTTENPKYAIDKSTGNAKPEATKTTPGAGRRWERSDICRTLRGGIVHR